MAASKHTINHRNWFPGLFIAGRHASSGYLDGWMQRKNMAGAVLFTPLVGRLFPAKSRSLGPLSYDHTAPRYYEWIRSPWAKVTRRGGE